jgi:hypothetical protein
MGWSRKGLKAIAELQAYASNGGKVKLKYLKPLHKQTNNLSKASTAKIHNAYIKTQEQLKDEWLVKNIPPKIDTIFFLFSYRQIVTFKLL